MTTKEFAAMFNMTVNEMCEFTGFSRDGLNEIVRGRSTKNGKKKTEAGKILKDRVDELYLEEREYSTDRCILRKGVVEKLFNQKFDEKDIVMDASERLTERNEHGEAYYPKCFGEPCDGSGECLDEKCVMMDAVCERLAAYEDAGISPGVAKMLSKQAGLILKFKESDGGNAEDNKQSNIKRETA